MKRSSRSSKYRGGASSSSTPGSEVWQAQLNSLGQKEAQAVEKDKELVEEVLASLRAKAAELDEEKWRFEPSDVEF